MVCKKWRPEPICRDFKFACAFFSQFDLTKSNLLARFKHVGTFSHHLTPAQPEISNRNLETMVLVSADMPL